MFFWKFCFENFCPAKTCVHMQAQILQLVQERESLPGFSITKLFWKTSQSSEVNIRSSHPKVFCQKVVLKTFAKFTRNHQCWSLFLIKLAARRPATLSGRLYYRCFCILWILWNFQDSFFAEHVLATTFDITLFFSFFQINDVYSLKTFYLVE